MPEGETDDCVKFRKEYLSEKVTELARLLCDSEGREVSESEALERAVSEYLAWLYDAEKAGSDEITFLDGENWVNRRLLGPDWENPDQ